MGSAAPLVQPVEPGQTVPGAARSSKFSNVNGPALTEVTAATGRFAAGEEGGLVSQEARSSVHARAVTPRGTSILMGSLRILVEGSCSPRREAQVSHLLAAWGPRRRFQDRYGALSRLRNFRCCGRSAAQVHPTRPPPAGGRRWEGVSNVDSCAAARYY